MVKALYHDQLLKYSLLPELGIVKQKCDLFQGQRVVENRLVDA